MWSMVIRALTDRHLIAWQDSRELGHTVFIDQASFVSVLYSKEKSKKNVIINTVK